MSGPSSSSSLEIDSEPSGADPGRRPVECHREATEALDRQPAAQVELAISAVLGGVEVHAPKVFQISNGKSRAGVCYGAGAVLCTKPIGKGKNSV